MYSPLIKLLTDEGYYTPIQLNNVQGCRCIACEFNVLHFTAIKDRFYQIAVGNLRHRIRVMLTDKKGELLNDIVEVDETYIGGSESNKHASKRKVKGGSAHKAMVLGAVQRTGKIKTQVIPETNIENIQKFIAETIEPNSTMVTDTHHAYDKLHLTYNHHKVNHKKKEYVRYGEIEGHIHTNTIEGYWNILKKQIDGIHHSVSPKHLQRYCNESAFRYNNKKETQDVRFAEALANCDGRLTYNALIEKA